MKRLLLAVLLLCQPACRKETPRVVPADELPQPTAQPHTRIAPGQRLPDDAVAEALQTGAYCYPLPGAVRRALWWQAGEGQLELTEQAADLHWRRVAVQLATGVSRVVAEPVDPATGLALGVSLAEAPGPPPPPEPLRLLRVPQGATWLVRKEAAGETLLEPSRAGPLPLVTVTPVAWVAAAAVPGGVVAGLLRQDTDGDGAASEDDEADLCLIARAVAPVVVTERQVPLARLAVADGLTRLAEAAVAAPVTLRWLQSLRRVRVGYVGPCALDTPAATARLMELHDAVTRTVDEVDLGLEVACQPNRAAPPPR